MTIDINPLRLEKLKALDTHGNELLLKSFWSNQSVVFIFLRHFACIACRAHAVQVWADREKYERNGAKLVFIGNGSYTYIEKFREDLSLEDALILTDPSLECFKAVGFRYGFFAVVQPRSLLNATSLALKGHRQGTYTKEAGTHWQLGGVIAFAKGGKPVYRFISESLGDHPPPSDIEV